MNVRVKEKRGTPYLECVGEKRFITHVQDALDLVGLCGENGASRIIIYGENLTNDFFDLKTCVAGDILQKFVNYRVKTAIVLSPEYLKHDRFREMALEANQSGAYGFFHTKEKAEAWLTQKG